MRVVPVEIIKKTKKSRISTISAPVWPSQRSGYTPNSTATAPPPVNSEPLRYSVRTVSVKPPSTACPVMTWVMPDSSSTIRITLTVLMPGVMPVRSMVMRTATTMSSGPMR